MKRDGPKAPAAIHGPLGLKFLSLEKGNVITDCLESQFKPRDSCDENHERLVQTRVQALLKAVSDSPLEKVRAYDVQKLKKLSQINRESYL
jgi:hypothetical protein